MCLGLCFEDRFVPRYRFYKIELNGHIVLRGPRDRLTHGMKTDDITVGIGH